MIKGEAVTIVVVVVVVAVEVETVVVDEKGKTGMLLLLLIGANKVTLFKGVDICASASVGNVGVGGGIGEHAASDTDERVGVSPDESNNVVLPKDRVSSIKLPYPKWNNDTQCGREQKPVAGSVSPLQKMQNRSVQHGQEAVILPSGDSSMHVNAART